METIRTIILILHITAGFIALIVGIIPFAAKKGGKLHNATGKVFYYAMIFVALSAFGLATYRFNPFLLMVGLLTLYSTLTGYRGLQLKRQRAIRGQRRDWGLLALVGLGLIFTVWQTITQFGTENTGILILVSVFGSLLMVDLISDIRLFSGRKTMTNKRWIRYHISRISGAYIAACTAFLVSNAQTDPAFIAWLLPTIIGIPLVSVLRRRYFAGKRKVISTQVELAK
ncbi:DUF2306 domain-containing protein [Tunicatimonas pelagia]|uniref:DUF2306 domain-containing protein n=1 Tax=Tunicatimonas pelagia TaxID=931531 RepID=UPI002666A032|nr:DUF2306 domain-containing protein [Tunicatimonas pelagia]WKN45832.1 DUF2306 domain-containing protein [Tunicatimonas pelagia]